MVLDRKTNFFLGKRWFGRENLGKRWFWREKPYFPRENKKNHLFGVWPHSVSKDVFFWFSLGKSWFFTPKPFFPRKKLVFLSKTIFFLGKTKKTIFLESGRIVSQKMVFLVFPKKSWFFIGRAQCYR